MIKLESNWCSKTQLAWEAIQKLLVQAANKITKFMFTKTGWLEYLFYKHGF